MNFIFGRKIKWKDLLISVRFDINSFQKSFKFELTFNQLFKNFWQVWLLFENDTYCRKISEEKFSFCFFFPSKLFMKEKDGFDRCWDDKNGFLTISGKKLIHLVFRVRESSPIETSFTPPQSYCKKFDELLRDNFSSL